MNTRFRLLASAVCLSCLSSLWADQVVMKNGDRVMGSIVKKDGKNLIIKTDQFGFVTTAWDQVDSIKTDKPINVVLQDGKTVQGTLATTEGKVEVVGQSARYSVAQSDITALRDDAEQKAYERLIKPGWGDLWAGTASVGFAGTSGNAKTLNLHDRHQRRSCHEHGQNFNLL